MNAQRCSHAPGERFAHASPLAFRAAHSAVATSQSASTPAFAQCYASSRRLQLQLTIERNAVNELESGRLISRREK